MRHLTAATIGEGFHYASLSSRGGHPLGNCANHPPHPTADDARRCYREWERSRVALEPQVFRNWGDCAVDGCDQPTKSGARLNDYEGFNVARLCEAHLTLDHALVAMSLDGDLAGDAWVS